MQADTAAKPVAATPSSDATPMTALPSDASLMARLIAGETACLGELYARHGAAVRDFVSRLLVDASDADAEDICQEVFLTLHAIAPRFRPESPLRPWVLGIAARKASAFRRMRWVHFRLLRRHAEDSWLAHPGSDAPDVLARRELNRALARLSVQHREVLLLHVIEALSAEEIAAALDIKVKTVWTRLHRARLALRTVLGESGPSAQGDDATYSTQSASAGAAREGGLR